MSDKIDQRIVEMSFENEKFEKGIKQSKSSLKEFTNALKDSNMDKDFSGLEKSVTSVSGSFSMMEQIGIGALRRIGESAVTAGTQLIKSLTIGQVGDGFNEYELKINTIRAIMNSTGDSAESVREKLKSLDDYADKTIFSTKDMFDNLATFTNAGIDLDKAANAMIGIANATAYAGQNTTSAMYAYRNFSDAISNGYMSLMDWRSISRVAKIGTQEFRQEILKTAVEFGTLTQAQIDSGAVTTQFEDTLKDQWLTADVVTAVLNKYGDATTEIGAKAWAAAQEVRTFSGMMESLKASIGTEFANMSELIFGDLEEAKKNFTYLNTLATTVFTSGVKNANKMLAGIKELGGISNIFQGLKNTAVAFLSVLKPISQAFDQIFPPKTKEQWVKITESFKNFTSWLIIANTTADKIKRTFAGLFAVVDIGCQVLKFLGQAAFEVIKVFLPLGDGFLSTSATLGDFLVKLNNAIKSSQILQYGLLAVKIGAALLRVGLLKVISVISDFVSGLWTAKSPLEYLKNVSEKVFSGLINKIKMVVNLLSGGFTKAVKGVSGFFNEVFDKNAVGVFPTILKILKEACEFIGGKAVDSFKNFGNIVKNLDFRKITTFVVGGILLLFVKQLSDLTGAMTGFTNSVTGAINGFTKKFLGTKTTSSIRDMAYALGVLAASIWVLSRIPADDLNKSLIGLAKGIAIFVAAYGLIQGINVGTSKLMKDTEMVSSAFGLINISAALLIMTVALKNISKIDEKQVWNSVLVLTAMLGLLTAYQAIAAVISMIPNQQSAVVSLLGMSTSLLSIVGVLAILKLISTQDIGASLGKLVTIMLVLSGLQVLFGIAARVEGDYYSSVSFLKIAVGVTAMVGVIKLLSIMKPETISQGAGNLMRIGILLAGLEFMFGLAGRISGGKKIQTNMFSIQIGLLSMVVLIAILGTMKQENIDRGIINLAKMTGIIGGIELLTAAAARISNGAKVQSILGAVSITLLAFTVVIAILGSINETIIDQGLLTLVKMVGVIAVIELVTAAASRISGDAKMFSNLMGATIAIVTVTAAIALLSLVDQEALRSAVISLAIASTAILALSVAMQIISNSVKSIFNGSQSFLTAIKNIGLVLVGFGVLFLTTIAFFGTLNSVLQYVENISWDSFGKFIAGLGAISLLMIAVDRIPISESGFLERMKGIVTALAGVGVILLGSIVLFTAISIVSPIIDSVKWETLSKFAVGLGMVTVLMGVIALTSGSLGVVGMNGINVFAGIISAVAGVAGLLLGSVILFSAISLVTPIIDSVKWDTLGKFAAGLAIVSVLVGGIALLAPAFGAVGAMGLVFLQGVVVAIGGVGAIIAAVIGIAELLNVLITDEAAFSRGLDLLVEIGAGIGRFIGVMVGSLAGGLLEGVAGSLVGFITQLGSFSPSSLEGLKNLASAILAISAAAVLDGIASFVNGKSSIQTFGEQLTGLVNAFKAVDPTDATAASSSMAAMIPMAENLKIFADAAKDIPNSGGWLGGIVGDNDIDTFGEKLVKLVTAFTGINTIQTTAAAGTLASMVPMAENLKIFANAAKNIPNSGGWLGGIVGDNDIDTFGEKLVKLITAFTGINTIQTAMASSTLETMKPMAENLKAFSTAAKDIPNSGGWLGGIVGDNDINAFGAKLAELITVFSEIDTTNLNTSTVTLQKMADEMLPALVKFSEFAAVVNATETNALTDFGKDFVKFVKEFKNVDFTVVEPALTAMKKVNTSFKVMGKTVIEDAKKSFENNKEPLQMAIATILDSPITMLKTKKNKLSDAVSEVFTLVRNNSEIYIGEFKKLGENIVLGLKNGIALKAPIATTAIGTLMTNIITTAKTTLKVASPSKVFNGIGEWCTIGLANGISSETKTAVNAGVNMAKATESGIRDTLDVHSESGLFNIIGNWIPKSLLNGIKDGKEKLLGFAKNLGIDTSNITLDGIVSTMAGGDSTITSSIKNLIGILTDNTQINGVAKEAGIIIGDTMGNGIGTGMGTTIADGVTDAIKDPVNGLDGSKVQTAVASSLELLKNWIEQENFFERMTPDWELYLFEGIRDEYPLGSKERQEIDRGIYARLKTIYDAKKSLIDGISDAQDAEKDEEKALEDAIKDKRNELLEQEKEERNEIRSKRYKEEYKADKEAEQQLTDLQKNYDDARNTMLEENNKEREKLKKDHAEKIKDIEEKLAKDIEKLTKEYDDALNNRVNSLYSAYGLFSKVEDKEEKVTGEELLQNLRDQGAALSEWKQSLEALSARGVDDSLITELRNLGPTSKDELAALLTLTDKQLDEYVGLFKGKSIFAQVTAEQELEGLRKSTEEQIDDLYKNEFNDKIKLNTQLEIDLKAVDTDETLNFSEMLDNFEKAQKKIEEARLSARRAAETTYIQENENLDAKMREARNEVEEWYNTELGKINDKYKEKIGELKESYSTAMKEIKGLTEEELRKLIEESDKKLAELNVDTKAELDKVAATYDTGGEKATSSFGTSLSEIIPNTVTKLENLANSVNTSFAYIVLDFIAAGKNCAAGFADGIRDFMYLAVSATEDLGHSAVNTVTKVLDEHSPSKVAYKLGKFFSTGFANGIVEYASQAEKASREMANGPIAAVSQVLTDMDDSNDLSFTITPVLDLSNIRSNDIAQLLNKPVYLGAASGRLANETVQNETRETVSPTTIVNKFDLTGLTVRNESDIDAIAAKLYQKQQIAARGRGFRSPART